MIAETSKDAAATHEPSGILLPSPHGPPHVHGDVADGGAALSLAPGPCLG